MKKRKSEIVATKTVREKLVIQKKDSENKIPEQPLNLSDFDVIPINYGNFYRMEKRMVVRYAFEQKKYRYAGLEFNKFSTLNIPTSISHFLLHIQKEKRIILLEPVDENTINARRLNKSKSSHMRINLSDSPIGGISKGNRFEVVQIELDNRLFYMLDLNKPLLRQVV